MLSVYHFSFARMQGQFKVINFVSWEIRALGKGVNTIALNSTMNTCPAEEIPVIFKGEKKPFINNTELGFIKGVFVRAVLDILPELQLNSYIISLYLEGLRFTHVKL